MRANTASQVKEPFASITVNFSGIVHLGWLNTSLSSSA
jgi:hypothetical protein